ncbi:MAG: hypothetical protein ACJ739_17895 [Acidimicrobiales bacterium]
MIPLTPSRDAQDETPAGERSPQPPRAAAILERRVGSSWADLPDRGGRAGLRAQALLASGPTAVDPAEVPIDGAIKRAHGVLAAARVLLGLLPRQVDVLGEVLGTDLRDAELRDLHDIAAAVAALGTVSRPVAAWGSVAGADTAAVVLEVVEPELREAARSHDELYSRFTERVWDIPTALVRSGSRRWRRVARRRLRRALRGVSRTTALPGGVDRAAKIVLDAHESRARLAPLRPLLAQHLGALDRGPLTDLAGALASLTAVRDLQRALGDRQDDRRLERLLLADAFRSREVARPSILVCSTITAWSGDVAAAGGTGALTISLDELRSWVDGLALSLPEVTRGLAVGRGLGVDVATVSQLVDLLVLREHVADLSDSETTTQPERHRWSAS